MSVAEKLTAIAENQQKVFDTGMTKGESDFWDVVQDFGNRVYYEYSFRQWTSQYLRPKYKVTPTSRSISMFQNNSVLKKLESPYFDLSQVSVQQSAGTGGHYYTFSGCVELEEIEDIGLPAGGYSNTFDGCDKLKTIAVLRVQEDTTANTRAFYCRGLENITIVGTIGTSTFNFQLCSKLTHESLMSILNALQEKTEGTWSVTLGATNLAKLTDAEKAMATQKGWTLA